MAPALTVPALCVVRVWAGPVGVIAAALLTHGLLPASGRQRDPQLAPARKVRDWGADGRVPALTP